MVPSTDVGGLLGVGLGAGVTGGGVAGCSANEFVNKRHDKTAQISILIFEILVGVRCVRGFRRTHFKNNARKMEFCHFKAKFASVVCNRLFALQRQSQLVRAESNKVFQARSSRSTSGGTHLK
jgi:hypothetical protein